MPEDSLLFPQAVLGDQVVSVLRRLNPWWESKPMASVPKTRRHLVRQIRRRLDLGLAPIIVVRGPRQIGKTTAHLQLIGDLLHEGISSNRILHVQFDELALSRLPQPIIAIVSWYESFVLKQTLNESAQSGQPAFLFFDEVQNLNEWAPELKSLVDSSTVKVFVTGSSALRIEQGRDSLAGRITTLETGVLSLTEIGALRGIESPEPYLPDNGLEKLTRQEFWSGLREYGLSQHEFRDTAFTAFSERGGYPLVHKKANAPWSLLADQLNETVIRRVIQHDLRIGERGRKRDAALLEELFRLACRYAGQSPSIDTLVREIQRALGGNVGSQRVTNYLRFLSDTLLIRTVQPLEIRLKRKKGSPKLCLVDHGLRASWLQEYVPLTPEELRKNPDLTVMAGHLAESVVGSVLCSINGLDISHFPPRHGEPEVDFVITIGATRIPIEVKYQARVDQMRDTEGLRAFVEKTVNNAPFGLLITQTDDAKATDPRIVTLPLSTLMLLR